MIVPFIDILFHSFILWSGQPYNEWMNNKKKKDGAAERSV